MSTGYYDRPVTSGTPIFRNAADAKREDEVARQLERAWRCELHPFGLLSPIDWYATREGHLVGLVELKSRSHPEATYPNVWLNVRKWLALMLGEQGMGVPATFVIQFTDALRSIRVREIDATHWRMGGCSRIVKSHSDIEPVIEVPVTQMKVVPLT